MNRYKQYWNNQPRFIKARFQSICKETGKLIKEGEECLYYPKDKTIYSMDSKTVEDFRSYEFDNKVLGGNY